MDLNDLLLIAGVLDPLKDLFHPLVEGLRWLLRLFDSWVGSWGLAIIMLTMLVRLCLLPLTVKQYRSAQAMQALQPRIKDLQRKYKKDRQKLQQETMRLYQEHRVNPFASCLPMVLQLPVFICLYYAIRGTPELQDASFLWIPKLGEPDPYYILFALYIITQLVSTELMMTPETEKQQKMIMRSMPIVFVFILFKFPSGLFVYWVTTNLWTIGQQIVIRRFLPKPTLEPKGKKKASRLMSVLTSAQEQQKERAAEAKRRAAGLRAVADGAVEDDGDGITPPEAPEAPDTTGLPPAKGTARPKRQGGRPRGKGGGKRPRGKGGQRPGGKSGQRPGGKRPNKPSGAGDGRKRSSS